MAISLIITHPNGTVVFGPAVGHGAGPAIAFLPPTGSTNTTGIDNSTPESCIGGGGIHGSLPVIPDVVGNWTVTPYVQYFFGNGGYIYQDDKACIKAPITGAY